MYCTSDSIDWLPCRDIFCLSFVLQIPEVALVVETQAHLQLFQLSENGIVGFVYHIISNLPIFS